MVDRAYTSKNNVELHLEKDSVLKFSQNFQTIHLLFLPVGRVECYNYSPFIYALNYENISITGKGVLDGQGPAWWHWKQLQGNAADRLCKAQSQNIPVEKECLLLRKMLSDHLLYNL